MWILRDASELNSLLQVTLFSGVAAISFVLLSDLNSWKVKQVLGPVPSQDPGSAPAPESHEKSHVVWTRVSVEQCGREIRPQHDIALCRVICPSLPQS